LVIVVSYCELSDEEIENFSPIVVLVDENNRPVKVARSSGGLLV